MQVHEKNRRLGCSLLVPPMDKPRPPPISHINISMEVAKQQLHQKLDHRQGFGGLLSLEDTRSLEKKEDWFLLFGTQGFNWIDRRSPARGNQAGQQC
jgi:hypothetical protein